jgi:hypothetical protein
VSAYEPFLCGLYGFAYAGEGSKAWIKTRIPTGYAYFRLLVPFKKLKKIKDFA